MQLLKHLFLKTNKADILSQDIFFFSCAINYRFDFL